MDIPHKSKDRRVVPNWRYYETTLAAGELDNWKVARHIKDSYSINDYVDLWNCHRSLYRAGDLISAAICNNRLDEASVKDAAKFILDNEGSSTHCMIGSARKVLGEENVNQSQSKIEIDRLKECTAIEDIRFLIHTIKQRIPIMPYNPFLYVDLARAYLLLGQTKKAETAINNALHYGECDRYVARSAARFYLHLKDNDRAYDIIRAKGAVSFDPWLLASEISINMLRGKTSNYVKKGREFIESGNCTPFGFTELASSLGTLEMSSGEHRKSNKLFRLAALSPNDNSLAQIQWAKSYDNLPFDTGVSVENDYEVKTIDAFLNKDYPNAIHEAVSWICDMPFARRPVDVGYSICTYLKDFGLASAILDVGLRLDDSNPFLLNNKAYCLARAGMLNDAQRSINLLLQSGRINDSSSLRVCVPATEGLILFRSGMPEKGGEKYEEALNYARSLQNTTGGKMLYNKAVLNYCREKLLSGCGNPDEIFQQANSVDIGDNEEELKLLYNEVVAEYKTSKK